MARNYRALIANRVAPVWLVAGTLLLAGWAGGSAAASVLTAPLEWRAMSVETGLDRVKEQFLDVSIRQDMEFVGAVLRHPDGSFEFTQGRGRPGQDQVSFRIRRPLDAELVGFWHTHGAHGPTRAIFSPTDAELVKRTGLPFFLITPEGEIRVLRPEHVAETNARSRLPGTLSWLPRGSHPGERFSGREQKRPAPALIADVTGV